MKRIRLTTPLLLQVLLLSGALAGAAERNVIWDVTDLGRFDPTFKGYSVEDARVTVNIDDGESLCPVGLFGAAKDRDPVREIVFRYRVAQAGRYWFHVIWHPGGSGEEQFEVLFNDRPVGKSRLVDGSETPAQHTAERFTLEHVEGENDILIRRLSGDGMRFVAILLSLNETPPAPINPNLRYVTLASYEAQIREPGIIFDSPHVRLYAPKRYRENARVVHQRYLVPAYDELRRITGVDTKYRIVVYSLPDNHPDFSGGTSECTLWYGYKNLDFESQPEWRRHRVPHVSGYIEEMGHNFVAASMAQFGWEMTGWSISRIAAEKAADNPYYRESLADARRVQAETFDRYRELGNTFPEDIPANLCDRIHAYLLHQCEQEYGPRFWSDVFTEIRESRDKLIAAERSASGDEGRNARYRVTVDCFDRVMKGKFKPMLKESGISLTTDVKSLHPTRPDWNRKLE